MSKQDLVPVEQTSVQRAPATIYEVFASMARDNSIEPSRIAQLMELQVQAEKREAEKAFIAAMTRLQPRLPRITKYGKIDLGKGKPLTFAKYEDVDAAIRPLLTEEGFSIAFGTAPYERGIVITATLSHASGHSRTESMPLPFDEGPGRNKLQAVGSTMSYGKRYLVCAMLNIVTENEDDDGNAQGYITENQALQLDELILKSDANVSKFLEIYGAKSIRDLHSINFKAALAQLEEKYRKKLDREKGMS